MIFITVGSRNYQFDRLFVEIDRLIEKGVIVEEVFAQIGSSNYIPKNYSYARFVSKEDFDAYIKSSNYVICHGASGTIMNALNNRKKVIAVTRLKKYNEHIDDHQIQNNIAFGENGYVVPVLDLEDLENAILRVKEDDFSLKLWENKDRLAIPKMIVDFINNL